MSGSATAMAVVLRPDGKVVYFKTDGTHFFNTGPSGLLTSNASGWRLTTSDGTVEDYGSDGRLLSVNDRGKLVTLQYSDASTPITIAPGPGYLIKASDAFGHAIQFRYDIAGHMLAMKDPAGLETVYEFNGPSAITPWGTPLITRLTKVTYPDATSRTYYYNEQTHTFGNNLYEVLTGLVDENGVRFASWWYHNGSNVIRSEHANGVERTHLHYGTNAVGVQQANQQTISYDFTSINDVVRVTRKNYPCDYWSGNCPTTEYFGYDPATGDMTSRTDPKGVQTTFVFDPVRHLETSRTEAVGTPRARTIGTQWHPTLNLPTQVDWPGRRETYTYDSLGNVLTQTTTDLTVSPNVSRTTTYTYNTHGRMQTIDGPRTDVSDITTYAYYSCSTGYQCGQVQTISNALGQVITFDTYNAHGQPLTITDANGVITTRTYDVRGRLATNTVGTEQTEFEYWPTGLLKKVTAPDGSFLQYGYDDAHRLTSIADDIGNHISYTYDVMSNRTVMETYDPSNALARKHTWGFNYVNQLHWDAGPTQPPGVADFYSYDRNGNRTKIAGRLNRNTSESYDELNRLSTITDPASGLTVYGYDALDQLISVTDPKLLTTTYTYNGLGDLKQQVSPDTGTTTNTFDSGGNLSTTTDARNITVTHSYDALDRVTSSAFGDQTISFGYDAGTNGKGRLTSASDADHSLAWTYDARGRVSSKQQIVGSVSRTVLYGYTAGNLTSITTPSGQSIVYGYTNGKVTSISVNGSMLLSGVLHDPFGPVRQWTWGNATLAVRTFDQDGKITQLDSAGLRTYSYDDAERITGITDTTDASQSWTYSYDALDRLTSATKTGVTQGFSYDANGNRLAQTGTSASSFTIASNSNRLSSTSGALSRTYAYDNAGNTTGYGGLTFAYNNRGRMVSSTVGGVTTSYVYNALGQRVRKTTGGTSIYFLYDEAGHLLGEYGAGGVLIQETVWFGDTPVAVLKSNGSGVSVFYVHSDHLNTPRKITRPSDNVVVWRWDSDPFGSSMANENPAGLGTFAYHSRFPGQHFDSETELNYNYFRDYDPATGRYVESDPIGLDGGINTYAYVNSNPVINIDPSGELLAPNPVAANPAGAAVAVGFGIGWTLGGAIYNALDNQIQDRLEKIFPYERSWRERRGRWKVYVRCNVTAFGSSCDCPPPNTIGGWAYGNTFKEAFANAQHDANANLGGLGKRNCYPRHCQPVACFENGRQVPCPKSGR